MMKRMFAVKGLFDRSVVFIVLVGLMVGGLPALSLLGCGGDDGGGLSPVQQKISAFNAACERYQKAMAMVGQSGDEMVNIVTANGTYVLEEGLVAELSDEQLVAHATALEAWSRHYRTAFLASYDMVTAARELETEQQTTGLWFDLPGGELEQSLRGELFTITGMLLMAAGVSVSTWLACKGTENAKTKACQDIKNIILATQNQVCLDRYASELEVPGGSGVTKEAILDHIENHPGRASYCTTAAVLMQGIVTGELAGTNCQAPAAEAVKATVYEVTQDVVETGATYAVSALTTVTSTPTSLIVQGAKVSEGAKTATELGITVMETAMQEYGSTLPDEVTVTGVSDATTTTTIPVSTSTNSTSEAVSVVASDDAFADALNAAMDDVVVATAAAADIPLTTTGYDGSKSIEVPNKVFVGTYPVAGLQASVTVPIPNIGFGTVMVFSPDTVPEVKSGVDTSQNNQWDLSSIGIPQWGEEKKQDDPPQTSGGGLTIELPTPVAYAGTDVFLKVGCPDGVAFPATLDTNTLSGVAISWSTFAACPFGVYFNADAPGDYSVNLTLTDAKDKKFQGTVTVKVVAEATECKQDQAAACGDAIFNDSSCFAACPPEDAGYREHEACKWGCSAANAYETAQCAYEFGCVNQYTTYGLCTSKCNFAYSACLDGIESDDPDFIGSCPSEQGACLAPCMKLL